MFSKSGFLIAILAVMVSVFLCGCEKALDFRQPKSDPVSVFDEMWNVIDQRYSLFSVKGVDWEESYRQYRPMITKTMADDDLFKVISRMLEDLKDGHVSLQSASDTSAYNGFYKLFSPNFNLQNLFTSYLKNEYRIIGPVIFKIVDNIGYIYYDSFEHEITDEQVLDIIRELISTNGLIVDVRNNPGGESRNMNRLFKAFITERKLVKYEKWKKGKSHDDFLAPEPTYITPLSTAYTKPIVVLTNRACFSSCNDFVYFMSTLPSVTLIGDHTGGGGGIPHTYILANGWKIRYTASITLTIDGNILDNGVEPDLLTEISSLDDVNGKDPILERAFLFLK